ncbi:YopX family protein [Lacticaseibacillus suilingensis]|uniref:YopX family protein n=1 Tax=Lacticaseibacillus suilingensis TaxID=2799577 RepID=UPI0022E54D90|nr:YopX family protein [Lacticaseibacillus suilingensis]
MRQIKFRAMLSDKYYAHPRMVPWGELLESFDALHIFDEDCMTLMQYTGLHDKNGREIYEGDIVHVWDNGVAVVIFDESLGCGQWMCKFKPAFPDFEEWSAPLYGWLDGNVDGSVFEILGNVYET